jgi:hypothetical protein
VATTLPLPSSVPQTTSAIAQSNIFPGAAISQSADKASLAGNGVLATHIVNLGARVKGIASIVASGIVFLDDWTLATGKKTLATGATYYAGSGGMLSTSGSQPVGIAISPTSLSVTIQNQVAPVAPANTSGFQSQIASLTQQLASLQLSIPKIFAGTFAIGSGVNSGTVTGQAVPFTPTRAIAVVRKQTGALNIFATVVDTTITTDGFGFVLSSLTDTANYKLDFIMLP